MFSSNKSHIFSPHREHKRLLRQTDEPHVYELLIDNSSLELFTTCPRQAEYKLVLGRTFADRAALSYGTAMHKALEMLSLGHSEAEAVDMLNEYFASNPVEDFEWRNSAFAIEALRAYLLQYKDAMWPLNKDNKYVEIGFNVPLDVRNDAHYLEVPVQTFLSYPRALIVEGAEETEPAFYCEKILVRWTGRIDLVTEQDGDVYIVDRKTSSIAGPTFWNHFYLSSQMRGYMYAARHVLDVTVKGLIVDALIGRKPTRTGVAHEFARGRFYYTQESLDEWLTDMVQHIEFFVSRLVRGMFPQATQWCMGKYQCKFHDVCKLPFAMRTQYVMSSMYEDNVWDPNLKH